MERNIDVPSPVIQHYDSTGQPMLNEPCDQGSECLADSGHGADSTEAQNNADRHREINPSNGSSLNTHDQSGDSNLLCLLWMKILHYNHLRKQLHVTQHMLKKYQKFWETSKKFRSSIN